MLLLLTTASTLRKQLFGYTVIVPKSIFSIEGHFRNSVPLALALLASDIKTELQELKKKHC
jgi:hypothetical protein